MKNKFVNFVLITLITAVSSFAQAKGGIRNGKSNSVQTTKSRVETPKQVEISKPMRDTTKAREAAKVGIKRHQDIQAKRGNGEKGRSSEVRMTEIMNKKGIRPDIISKSKRPFEIKPNTVSGYRKGREQLKRQENVVGRRGGLVLYEPKTEKYKIERTPYNEWKKRQQEIRQPIRPKERPREIRPRIRF